MLIRCLTDPILRAPVLGAMLICSSVALVGVLIFVKKQSLLGEALSHATYPGVTLAILLAGATSTLSCLPILVLLGAASSSLLALSLIDLLSKKLSISSDSSLCFILSFFFGIGVTIASYVQNAYPMLFRQTQAYLYGQIATIGDIYIYIYLALLTLVILFIFLFYKEIYAISFDIDFAKSCKIAPRSVNGLSTILIILATIVGIRSVGIVLMSAMLIAPAAAARQFSSRLSSLFFLSCIIGCVSAFFGSYLSIVYSEIPTGPLIAIIASGIAVVSLVISPKRGSLFGYHKSSNLAEKQTLMEAADE